MRCKISVKKITHVSAKANQGRGNAFSYMIRDTQRCSIRILALKWLDHCVTELLSLTSIISKEKLITLMPYHPPIFQQLGLPSVLVKLYLHLQFDILLICTSLICLPCLCSCSGTTWRPTWNFTLLSWVLLSSVFLYQFSSRTVLQIYLCTSLLSANMQTT